MAQPRLNRAALGRILSIGLLQACVAPAQPGADPGQDGADAGQGDLGDKAIAACPGFDAPVVLGRVQTSALNETSGMASSREHPGVLWVHNDSGDSARVFALAENGSLIATVNVGNASARDWEDMATGPGPGGTHIYVADFGDNGKSRGTYQIYRFREPVVSASERNRTLSVTAERMTFQYPGGSRNTETLLIDPQTGELATVIKGDGTYVYSLGQFTTSGTRTAVQVGQINKAKGGIDTATGGDVSADGSYIAVRDYDMGKLWRRPSGGSLWSALTSPPCSIPIASGGGGEGLAFAANGTGYLTLNEGASNPIHFMRLASGGPTDNCPNDPSKTEPGSCGCSVVEGTCSGGVNSSTRYEAESRTGTQGCSQASNQAGFTGAGFMDFGGNGTWIEWNNINAPAAGQYTLTFRYANASSAGRPATVSVNGQSSGSVAFAGTGGWTSWKTVPMTVSLRKGNNTLRVTASSSSGGPNLDNVLVAGTGGSDACSSTMGAGERMLAGDELCSPSGRYKLVTGSDGVLSLLDGGKVLWASPTCCQPVHVEMQASDGNLVIYNNSNKALWASNTGGHPGASLTVEDNGTAIVHIGNTVYYTLRGTDTGTTDNCPNDPSKTEPGSCGCGVAEGTCSGKGKYVFVISMENHDSVQVYGNSDAPYLNQLATRYARATNFQDTLPGLPSEPHYLWMEAGTNSFSDHTFSDNGVPTSSNSTADTRHLVTQLKTAGKSWLSYQEGMNSSTGACPISASGFYQPKHDPFIFFQDVSGSPPSKTNAYCVEHHRPLSAFAGDLTNNRVAAYNFITPDQCHDMHGQSGCPSSNNIKAGDDFLASLVPSIITFLETHNGVLFIVWDEGDSTSRMPFFAIGPTVKRGHSSSVTFTHSSLLKTTETMLGVPVLSTVAGATMLNDLFVDGQLP